MKPRRLSTSKREELYDRWRGDAEYPVCNICRLPIHPGQDWDESHNPLLPRSLGGDVTGLAHRRCNRGHAHAVDVPLIAKNKRTRQKHIGAFRTRTPLPGGRNDPRKRTMRGEVVSRATGERWGQRK